MSTEVPTTSPKRSTQLSGHGLANEGAPFTATACEIDECATYFGVKRIWTRGGGTSGPGHASCKCGWMSDHVASGTARRREYDAHKAESTGNTGTASTTDQEEHSDMASNSKPDALYGDQLDTDIKPGPEVKYTYDQYGEMKPSTTDSDGDDPYNDPDRLTPRQHDWEEKGGPFSKTKRLNTEKRENERPYDDPTDTTSGLKADKLKVDAPSDKDEDVVDPEGTSDPGTPATTEQRSDNPTESDKVK